MISKRYRELGKKIAWLLLAVVFLFNSWILISGKVFFYKMLYYNYADIDDYKIFPKRQIAKTSPKPWNISSQYNKKNISDSLNLELEKLSSIAFLLIKNDSILFEKYWKGYHKDSYSNSFSMAKSYVSALIGIAIKEKKIKSIDQPIADFLPSFKQTEFSPITIRHLLMMSSGLNWDEGYANPLSVTTEAYYGSDLKKLVLGLKPIEEPGKIFRYKSGDTQLLSFILEKATGEKISDYASKKLWTPLGCESNAIWSLDKENGDEKAYCCINSNARDFAKFGKLYLDSGNVNKIEIIPKDYLLESIRPNLLPDGDLDMKPADFYGYQWWVIPEYKGENIFYARGILGQYIIVIPSKEIIIVRLGEKRGEAEGKHYREIFLMIDEALKY